MCFNGTNFINLETGYAVGIETDYGMEGRGIVDRAPAGISFCSLYVVQTCFEAHPAS
jgi:hypothetical protein